MKKILSLFACLLLFGTLAIFGQDVQINGSVTSSEDGSPVPGAYVKIKGVNKGTTTDVDGKYQITVPSDASLIFSSIGFVDQEIAVSGQSVIDVVLQVSVTEVDDVIVVGYTTVRKEANTGAVNVVKSDKLKDVPEMSFDKMLSGKVSGVMITSTSGQPNSASQIRVRGITSLTSGNEPLIVIDGTPVMTGDQSTFTNTSNALSAINPNDVESVTMLKDASATSIYGSRGANGVMLITTKSGKTGQAKINFRASYGISQLANDNNYGIMSAPQILGFMRDAVVNAGHDPDDPDEGTYYVPNSLIDGEMTDWLDEVTRKGQQQNYELTYSGGNENSKFYVSGGYTSDEGVFHGIDFKKYQLRVNLDQKLNNWLTAGVRVNGAHSFANDMAMQSLYYANPLFAAQGILPWTPVRNEDGSFNLVIPENSNTNPVATAAYDDQWEKQNRILGSVYFEAKLLKGLTFKTTNSYELTDGEGRRYWSAEADAGGSATLQTSNAKYSQLTTSNTLTYDTRIAEKHGISLLAGQEAMRNDYDYYYLWSPEVDPDIPFPSTSTDDLDYGDYDESSNTMLSYFGIINYEFDTRYFLKFSLRTDGSSRFGEETKWGTFYSVGASWMITNESFMESQKIFDILKLRASYGINGNDQIGNYKQWGLYSSSKYNGVSGLGPSSLPNPELTWELNKTYNIGIDFGILNRVTGSIEYYDRKTVDMLLDSPLSRTTGLSFITDNVGEVDNRGYEALVNVAILDGNFTWDVGANISHNKSELLSLAGGQTQFPNVDNNRILHKVGESMYSYYLFDYAGVNPVNGEALWYDNDGKLTNSYSSARRFVAGSPEPKFTGGFNSSVSWKGLMFDVSFEFKTGNKVLIEENRYLNSDGFNWGANQATTALDYWKKPGDITRNPKPIAQNPTSSSGFRSTRWMQDGDYLRIKNLTLSYTLPTAISGKLKLQQLRIYTSAVNIFTFHNVDFFDPERGVDGSGFGIHPMTKKIMFGIELSL